MLKFHGSIKKEVEFPAVTEKKSCGVSIGLGISPSNFEDVPHNFVEYPKVKFLFSLELARVK